MPAHADWVLYFPDADTSGSKDATKLFNTAEGRVKPRNIRRKPVVSICVYNHENPYQYLSVTGPAELSDEGAEEHINELSHRYYGRDYHYVPGEKRLIVRIKPERVFARGF